MINLERKLTADDLIVEYMICKLENGYGPSYTVSEFMELLNYFKDKREVVDTLPDGDELITRFFNRKGERDWSYTIDFSSFQKEIRPHMIRHDDVIEANYSFSGYDKSLITTYFMPDREKKEIKNIILSFLDGKEKRIIPDIGVTEDDILCGKLVAASIIGNVWDTYVDKQIEYKKWPRQCRDIKEFLLDFDLAPVIKLESRRDELLEFYKEIARRIAIMHRCDPNLKISTSSGSYLAYANYMLLKEGYEEIFDSTFGPYKKSLDIDLEKRSVVETHEIDGFYMWDEDADTKRTETKMSDGKLKVLVNGFDENVSKGQK